MSRKSYFALQPIGCSLACTSIGPAASAQRNMTAYLPARPRRTTFHGYVTEGDILSLPDGCWLSFWQCGGIGSSDGREWKLNLVPPPPIGYRCHQYCWLVLYWYLSAARPSYKGIRTSRAGWRSGAAGIAPCAATATMD